MGPESFPPGSVASGERRRRRSSFLGATPSTPRSAGNRRLTLRRAAGRAVERLPDGRPRAAIRSLFLEIRPVGVSGLPRLRKGALGRLADGVVRHAGEKQLRGMLRK